MKTTYEPQRVSAADFIRGFANWRLQSTRKPVVVTHHGKDAHVLISLDDYRRLDGDIAAEVSGKANALQAALAGVVDSIRDAVILIDRQWRIAATNPAACDLLGVPAAALAGTDLADAIPGLGGSLLSHRLSRLIDHRERFSGDLPGVLQPGRWIRVDLVPIPQGGAVILRDISDMMEDCAMNDARSALATAIDVQRGIGHARISVRETVTAANEALTTMIGVDATAIRRVRFSALLAVGRRQDFAEAIEQVFRTGQPARLASEIVTREGAALPVTLAMVEIRGAYASEGAIILVAPAID